LSAQGRDPGGKSGRLSLRRNRKIDAVGMPDFWQWGSDNAGSGEVSLKEINASFRADEQTGTNGGCITDLQPGA